MLELVHNTAARLRFRWVGDGSPPDEFVEALSSASGVIAVDYRPNTRSLVVQYGSGFNTKELGELAKAHVLVIGDKSQPVPLAAPCDSPANGGAKRTQPKAIQVPPRGAVEETLTVCITHATIPGRVRLQVPALKLRPRASARLGEKLASLPGIREARITSANSSILVEYDPVHQTIRGILDCIASSLRARVNVLVANGQSLTPDWDRKVPKSRSRIESMKPRDSYRWAAAAPVSEVMRELGVPNKDGLTPEEVARRAAALAGNQLDIGRRRNTTEILREQFVTIPTIMLAAGMGMSMVVGAFADAVAIGAVLLANGGIGYYTERYAEGAIEALRKLGFPQAHVARRGIRVNIPAAELVPGDVIRLRAGFIVPADARIIEGRALINESMLTGESEPVTKHAGITEPPKRLHDFQNVVFQGTSVVDGRVRAVVLATGKNTELGRIQGMVQEAEQPKTNLQRELDYLGKVLSIGAVAVSGVLLGVGLLRGLPVFSTIQTIISLAVSAVPEGLPATATTALAVGMSRMLRRKAIIRRLPAVESLGSVTVLCVDKTGTVTLNRMTASHYWWQGRVYRYQNGDLEGHFTLSDRRIDPRDHRPLDAMLKVGILCNEAKLWNAPDGPRVSGSSTEGALLLAGRAAGYWYKDLRSEFPLRQAPRRTAGQMLMTSVHANPDGSSFIAVKGAPEAVLKRCSHRINPDGDPVLLTAEDVIACRAANKQMAEEGLRVLAFAQKTVPMDASIEDHKRGLVWLGLVGLEDPIRPGVREALDTSRVAGIRTIILTGDQRGTALAVARTLGLAEGSEGVMEAGQLDTLGPAEIAEAVGRVAVFARVSPEDKLRIVRALQAAGHVVAMTGDGINDGPALKAADIGIALGEGSSDVAKELADVVLTQNDFGSIVAAVEQGRVIYTNIARALSYLIASNVSELMVAAVTLTTGIPFPFRPIQILWMNLVSDVFPALALVMEPTDHDVMRQPPRPPGTPLIGRREGLRLTEDAAVLALGGLAAFLVAAGRYGYGVVASTVAFTAVTIGEALYAYAWSAPPQNRGRGQRGALLPTIGATVALQVGVNHWKPMQGLLHVAPLALRDYFAVAAAAVVPAAWATFRSRRAALPAPATRLALPEPAPG